MKGNKNETLARCRLLWATMLKHNCDKYKALNIIYGPNKYLLFTNNCPICDYVKSILDNTCINCIDWNGMPMCDVEGASYNTWRRIKSKDSIKKVIKTIDKAIAKFDKTGNWR